MDLNQITIPVRDVAKSISFYGRMGHRLIVRDLPHYARFESKAGSSTFSLHFVDQPVMPGVWIYFEVPDVDEVVTELQQSGFYFEESPQDKSWLWREARLKDPDGNLLIIYHAGKNRLFPPWRLNP